LFTARDYDAADYAAHSLPEELRTAEQVNSLRTTANKALGALAKSQLSKRTAPAQSKLQRAAASWLNHPLVRSSHAAMSLTPMDGVLSLSATGQLQVAPRFSSPDAQYAVTFAELIQEDCPALIKRCATCANFFVYMRGARGQPRKLCDAHYEESKQTRKKTQ
jgi:hypothetical protein